MRTERITACIIVKNEAANIEKWLTNTKQYADEILIVDTGSTDNTLSIIEQDHTANISVYNYDWQDDFSAARNFALDMASGDWIVFTDADELFVAPQMIINTLQNMEENCNGLWVLIRNLDETGKMLSEFYALRIWRNNDKYRYLGRVHEALYASGEPIADLRYEKNIILNHSGYAATLIGQKLARNLAMLEAEIAEIGEQPRHYRYLAQCYAGLGEPELCLNYVQRALAEEEATVAGRGELYHLLLKALYDLDAPLTTLLQAVAQACQAAPECKEFLVEQAKILLLMGRYAEARACLQEFYAQTADVQALPQYVMPLTGYLQAVLAVEEGCYQTAAEAAQRSLHENPYQEECLTLLAKICQHNGNDFLAMLRTLYGEADNTFLKQWLIREGQMKYIEALGIELPLHAEWLGGDKQKIYATALGTGIGKFSSLFYILLSGGEKLKAENPDYWRRLVQLLPQSVRQIVYRLHGKLKHLAAADWDGYSALLKTIPPYIDTAAMQKLALVAQDFPPDRQMEAARSLTGAGFYKQALYIYENIAQNEVANKGELYYGMGKCLFFTHDRAARSYLDKAVQCGISRRDIPAYLAWLQS